jgi:hypothetical protein
MPGLCEQLLFSCSVLGSFIWLMPLRKKWPPPELGVRDKLTVTVLCKKNEKGDIDNNILTRRRHMQNKRRISTEKPITLAILLHSSVVALMYVGWKQNRFLSIPVAKAISKAKAICACITPVNPQKGR